MQHFIKDETPDVIVAENKPVLRIEGRHFIWNAKAKARSKAEAKCGRKGMGRGGGGGGGKKKVLRITDGEDHGQ